MKPGDKLIIVKHFGGLVTINFNSEDKKTRKVFTIGDALEALKYLLLDEEGRKRKDATK